MCGIAGWVSFDRNLRREQETLQSMTSTMVNRGPDAGGLWVQPHVGLGHRRLSIIDLEGGRQPMVTKVGDDEVAITYSGEAYNFTELRDELRRRGHHFRTTSDTEVVLRAYVEWGEALVDHLNGMYAFAVWDSRRERLLLVRDRLGVKPLYFYPTADGVLFGSEPKAILANPLARPVVDVEGLREIFSFVKTPGVAVWKGMREVQPGTVITVDRSGLREHTYWRLEAKPHTDDEATSIARVRQLLEDIVRHQLVADVPRCMLLSGGLDSSALTALADRELADQGELVRTFAVDFTDQVQNFTADNSYSSPDAPFVQEVAGWVGTDHRDIVLDSSALSDPELRQAAVTARDLPVGFGDLDTSLYLLFQAVREHSTVALSGEAADEVFGGYWWMHEEKARQSSVFPWLAHGGDNQHSRAGYVAPDLVGTLDVGNHLVQRYAEARAETPVLDGESEQDRRMRELCYVHLTRHVQGLLDRKDRISMAVGLEVRVPFCDHRLVEYAFNAPWSLKTFDSREKSLLRGAVADVVPRSVLDRKKSQYPMTQDLKYVEYLQRQVEELLSRRDSDIFHLFDVSTAKAAVALEPAEIPRYRRLGVERLLDVAVWLDIYHPSFELS